MSETEGKYTCISIGVKTEPHAEALKLASEWINQFPIGTHGTTLNYCRVARAADEIERLLVLVDEMEELIRDIQKLAGDKFPISPEAIDRRLTASKAKSDKE